MRRQAGAMEHGVERGEVGRLDDRAGVGQQLGAGALRLDPSAADDHDPVGDGLDLGVAQQRVGEAQAPAHAERVLADPPPSRRLVEADELQQRFDALRRHAHGLRGDGERLAAAAPGVLRRRVEQDPDAPAGVRQVAVALAEDPRLAAVGLGQAGEHPHRRGLAGAVGANEARDGARLAAERDIGDDRAAPESLGESLGFDHDRRLAATGVTAPFGDRRATRTMAALTAMIERRPTHCSVSPMPSPQYGLEGPTSTGIAWKKANAVISVHATTAAARAAERCLNASRRATTTTATRLARCWGLVNVSSTPADGSVRRSSKTARLRTRSAPRAPVRPSNRRLGSPEALIGWVIWVVDIGGI